MARKGWIIMKKLKAAAAVLIMMMCILISISAGSMESRNPLIHPKPISTYTALDKDIKNILLLGIDKSDAAAAKGSDYHTDAILVVAVNFDEGKMDLISLPRDTLTYVPGIKGIYKLNAAINCGGGKTEEGFQKVCEAAAWVLGGIKIDYYCAVDMQAMAAIGDAIGGVDFELEMSYTGTYGKYRKGLQHLNGKGILDYLRARRNATQNANDLGRTSRQRDLIMTILKKMMSDKNSLASAVTAVQDLEDGFFTNMSIGDMLAFLPLALRGDFDATGSHVITGKYRTALNGWNFTFTDQDNRREVIRAVYGVEVPELAYVSYAYTKWLVEDGFAVVRYLAVAQLMRERISAYGETMLSAEQKEALAAFDLAYDQAAAAFDAAADSMSKTDTKLMAGAAKELRKHGDALYERFEGVEKPVWATGKYWYADRMINEVDVNFR